MVQCSDRCKTKSLCWEDIFQPCKNVESNFLFPNMVTWTDLWCTWKFDLITWNFRPNGTIPWQSPAISYCLYVLFCNYFGLFVNVSVHTKKLGNNNYIDKWISSFVLYFWGWVFDLCRFSLNIKTIKTFPHRVQLWLDLSMRPWEGIGLVCLPYHLPDLTSLTVLTATLLLLASIVSLPPQLNQLKQYNSHWCAATPPNQSMFTHNL